MSSLFLLGLMGCFGSDYQVFQVAGAAPVIDPSCYGGATPDEVASDSDTFDEGATIAIFSGPDDQWFLQLGSTAVPGTKDGGTWSFTGVYTDVIPSGSLTITATTEIDVTAEISGKKITGTFNESTSSTCDGGRSCPDNATCSVSQEFSGVRVGDDVPTQGTLGDVYIGYYGGGGGYSYDTGLYY